MFQGGKTFCVFAAVAAVLVAPSARATGLDFAGERPSTDARRVAQWVVGSGDNKGLPFAIVDKKDARLFVFDAGGRVIGATPALLGLAPGDDSLPGVGDKNPSLLKPFERTTPAGRFDSEPGRNHTGEAIVWFDYDAALAIHRLRPGKAHAARTKSLVSPTPADRRASLGCVVVPAAFYDSVVAPTLGRERGVVYVLPEMRPVNEVFGNGLIAREFVTPQL
jgi:hypothetical protein